MNIASSRIKTTIAGIRDDESLRFENYQVVCLVQALLGSISSNMVVISLEIIADEVHLYFHFERESESDRTEVGEIAFKFGALQLTNVQVFPHILVASASAEPLKIEGRPIYLRRDP